MAILGAWERGLPLDRWRRDDAVLSELAASERAPRSLGARNAAFLRARNGLFDPAWPLASDCPACGETCTFEVDSVGLSEALAASLPEMPGRFDWQGADVAARAPTVDDLINVARGSEPAAAIRALLARCITYDIDDADDATVEALGARLETLFPATMVRFALACPACEHDWSAAIDLGDALWLEVQRAAEAVLVDVDALARAYGWDEETVLRLSPARRAAYLQLVGAE
jgi:hypothetical protein